MASVDKALDDMSKDIEKQKKQAEAEVRTEVRDAQHPIIQGPTNVGTYSILQLLQYTTPSFHSTRGVYYTSILYPELYQLVPLPPHDLTTPSRHLALPSHQHPTKVRKQKMKKAVAGFGLHAL